MPPPAPNGPPAGPIRTAPAAGSFRQTATRPRFLRVDLWRGVAILFIFINHLPANPLQAWTTTPHGFSDTAVWFFFLSGFVARLVYSRVVREQGLAAASAKIARRLVELYACHIFLALVFIGTAWLLVHGTEPAPVWLTKPAGLLAGQSPGAALVGALTFQLNGFCINVLPSYLVLLALFLGTTALERRFRVPPMLVALALFGLNVVFRRQFFATWSFNPLSWQLLFHLGGWVYDRRDRLVSGGWRTATVLALAWAALLTCTFVRHAHDLLPPDWADRVARFEPLRNKILLNPPYLFHGLLTLFALGCLGSDSTIARFAPLRGLAVLGRKPLALFVTTTVTSFSAYYFHGRSLGLFAAAGYLVIGLGLGAAYVRLTTRRA